MFMTLQDIGKRLISLYGNSQIDQSSAALAYRVAWEGRLVQLPIYCFEGLFTECCLEYLSTPHGQKRVIVICEGVSVKAEYFDFNTGNGGLWHAKMTQDGIADLLTAAFMFLA